MLNTTVKTINSIERDLLSYTAYYGDIVPGGQSGAGGGPHGAS